jgi:GNAT superfamily N-acetyltransferase
MIGSAKTYVRQMTREDIPAGMELVRAAGWNQTEADWNRFLDAGSEGCFVAECESGVCGSTATITYGSQLAWIGMVLVRPSLRGRGIGTELVRWALEYLESCGRFTVKLDATPQGRPVYQRLGFEPECEIERWMLSATRSPQPVNRADGLENVEAEFEQVIAMDAELFGASRSALLRSLHQAAPEFTAVTLNERKLVGYTLGRHGLHADHLGPWAAQDQESARQLLERFLACSTRSHLIVDRVKSNPFSCELLQSAGFEFSRPVTRMVRGPDHRKSRSELLCAILGPEFG